MGKRKSGKLFIILLIIFFELLIAAVSEENIMPYEALIELQKKPNDLQYALDRTLSTVMYAEENFPSQASAEMLLKRIYTKMELTKQFSLEDEVFTSIIKESTGSLLKALQSVDEETDRYTSAYSLMDFVNNDFSQMIEQFHFEKFKEFFQLNKLKDFQLIESIDGEQIQKLTAQIIETIIQNNYYLNEETYNEIAKLGKNKFLNYLSIQITPYLNKKRVEEYEKQFSLLKAYTKLYKTYHGQAFEQEIPEEKYLYYTELTNYYDYISNVEILSRRFLTAEKETLSNLFPVFLKYVEQYNTISLKTEILNNAVQRMIKNASTRLSYDKNELIDEGYDLKGLSIANEELNENLKNLISVIKIESQTKQPEQEDFVIQLLTNPTLIYSVFIIMGILFIVLFALPLKFKATLLKNIGLNSRSLSLFEKAAIKHPMDPDLHIKTAQIYEKLGREEEAMNEYKIASKVLDMKED